MTYPLFLKYLHITCVVLSFVGFFIRGLLLLIKHEIAHHFLLRKFPHFVDSTLFFSALLLLFEIHEYPFTNDWLTAKIIALLLYIVMGTLTFKIARSVKWQFSMWVSSMVVFFYIVGVAFTHNVLSFLVYLN